MWDGIIVGGGLAGLIAGIRALENGRQVLIIAEGVGSLGSAAGVFDFGDVAELQRRPKHPYALFDLATIRQSFDYFLQLCPQYTGEWGRTNTVLTPLGTERRAGLVPRRLKADLLQTAERIILVAPEGLKDFFPEVIRANLQQHYPQAQVLIKPVQTEKFKAWSALGQSVFGNNYSKFWSTEAGITSLNTVVQEISAEIAGLNAGKDSGAQAAGEAVLVFPSLAAEFSEQLEQVLAQAPLPVMELTAFPPSAIGLALYEALKRKFQDMGGEILVNGRVLRAEFEQGECRGVIVNSKGKELAFRGKSYIIATGGILGGGIQADPQGVREVVAGLALFVPPTLTKDDFLDDQPYALIGVETDSGLRPLDPQTGVVLGKNVMVAGRTLGHWDPWRDGCGGGVSITSGFVAGAKI